MKKGLTFVAVWMLTGLTLAASLAGAEEAVGNQGSSQTGGTIWKSGSGAPNVVKKMKPMKKSKIVKNAQPAAVEKDSWICPMCHIKADKPGKCPECGMDMVKMPKNSPKKN